MTWLDGFQLFIMVLAMVWCYGGIILVMRRKPRFTRDGRIKVTDWRRGE